MVETIQKGDVCEHFNLAFNDTGYALFPCSNRSKSNRKSKYSSRYSGANKHSTSPVKFENGQKAWLSQKFIEMSKYEYLYLEKTPLFKDIKYVKVWQFDR